MKNTLKDCHYSAYVLMSATYLAASFGLIPHYLALAIMSILYGLLAVLYSD
jgi:hypothetical protein